MFKRFWNWLTGKNKQVHTIENLVGMKLENNKKEEK
jgi:hypothetical protein